MTRFLLTRCSSALFVILGVCCLVFILIHLIPGDPIDVMLGENAHPTDKEALRKAMGFHLPVHVQLRDYLLRLLQLDLGHSIHSGRAITEILQERLPATIELGLAAFLVSILLAFPLGIAAAMRQNTVTDVAAMTFALGGVSIPNFWMGPMLILVGALWLGWFPVSGREGFLSLVLPALTLGTAMAAILSRMIRSALLEVIHEDYIRTAHAKGLSSVRTTFHHALRNAMLPVLTLLGLQLGALLSGAVITETIFSWPGLGSLMIEAIQQRDYPIVQAAILCISGLYIGVNLLTDVLYAWIDPRIRIQETS
ncbi:MAG: ABC transporter permease [Nitrospirales bacterium]|nr:ABC transporter permease [Nitrospira sp.]MDR4500046.1 ABC transporter permease [Nitrospirales bacterium]